MGFKIEDDLNTEHSRKIWLEWKRRIDPRITSIPKRARSWQSQRPEDGGGRIGRPASTIYGTINCNGINAKGEICGVTTTSGLAWKIPGGSAIHRFWARAFMSTVTSARQGRPDEGKRTLQPLLVSDRGRDATRHASEGCRAWRPETDQGKHDRETPAQQQGQSEFRHQFLRLNAKGEYAGVSMYEGSRASYAICNDRGPQTLICDGLLPGKAE